MHSLTHATSITETAATEIIMSACQYNAQRWVKTVQGYTVSFDGFCDGTNKATVKDANGFAVAHAFVDKFDC